MKWITGFLFLIFFSFPSYASNIQTDSQFDNPTLNFELLQSIHKELKSLLSIDRIFIYPDIVFDQAVEQTFMVKHGLKNKSRHIKPHIVASIKHNATDMPKQFYRRGIGKRFIG